MNIHNAPADMRYYASLTDDELRELAIDYRNEILDELRRREEAMEAEAEGRYGTYDPEPWAPAEETLRGYQHRSSNRQDAARVGRALVLL